MSTLGCIECDEHFEDNPGSDTCLSCEGGVETSLEAAEAWGAMLVVGFVVSLAAGLVTYGKLWL